MVEERQSGEAWVYRCQEDGFVGDLDAAMRHLIDEHQGRWTIVLTDRPA